MLADISPKQFEFLERPEPFVFFCGGVGSGKTEAGARWVIREALYRSPGIRGFIGANTYAQLYTVTVPPLLTLLDELGIEYRMGRAPPPEWGRTEFPKHNNCLSLRWPGRVRGMTQILCRSLENPTPLRGLKLGWFWLDEVRDAPEEAFQILLARMRGYGAAQGFHDHVMRGALTTTPSGYNWVWESFVGPKRFADVAMITATSYDNPWLPRSYADGLLKKYSARYAKQEIYGQFVNLASGQACPEFDRLQCVRADIQYDPTLPIVHSWDFNVNPIGTVVGQRRGDDAYVIDEIRIEGSARTLDACEEFINRYGHHQGLVTVYGDASGRKRDTRSTHSDFDLIAKAYGEHFGRRVAIKPNYSNPSVKLSVGGLCSRLLDGDGNRHLFLSDRCAETIADLEQVAFVEGTQEIDKSDHRRTHQFDALRYWISAEWPLRSGKLVRVA